MKHTQDSRHYSLDEVTSEKFRVLRQGDLCNILNSADNSIQIPTIIKLVRLLNIGIRWRCPYASIRT
jgi:hypothetical protein